MGRGKADERPIGFDRESKKRENVKSLDRGFLLMSAYEAIYAITRQIPSGKVATYGQIAFLSGRVGQARLVGYALHRVDSHQDEVPWQRVVNAKGEISYSPLRRGSDYHQRALLEAEGIDFDERGKIDLRRYQWRPEYGDRSPVVSDQT